MSHYGHKPPTYDAIKNVVLRYKGSALYSSNKNYVKLESKHFYGSFFGQKWLITLECNNLDYLQVTKLVEAITAKKLQIKVCDIMDIINDLECNVTILAWMRAYLSPNFVYMDYLPYDILNEKTCNI
jgi:hypothetical protein